MGQVTLTVTAKEAQAIAALERVIRAEAGVEQQARKTGRAASTSANQAGNAIGKWSGQITSLVGQYVGLQAVIQAATKVVEENRQAVEGLQAKAGGAGQLAQLAGGDQQVFQQLMSGTNKILASGNFENFDQASQLMFALKSAGLEEEAGFAARLQQVENSQEFVTNAAVLRNALGEGEVGGLKGLASKALLAASFTPQAGAGDILSGAGTSAAQAGMLGLSDEELLAAQSIATQKAKSADVGGTQIRSLFTSLVELKGKGQVKGGTLAEMIQDIEGQGLGDAELLKRLGRTEAVSAFSALSGSNLSQLTQQIAEAEASGGIDRTLSLVENDPNLKEARMERQVKAQYQIDQTENARDAALASAARTERGRIARERMGQAGALYDNMVMNPVNQVVEILFGSEAAAGDAISGARAFGESSVANQIENALERGTAKGMAKGSRGPGVTASQDTPRGNE